MTHEPRAGYYCTDAWCPDCGRRHLDASILTGEVDPLCGPCYYEALADEAEREARRIATAFVRAETLKSLFYGLRDRGVELDKVLKPASAIEADDNALRVEAARRIIGARRADPQRIAALRRPQAQGV